MNSDLTEAYAVMGSMIGITQTIETKDYQGNILKFMHEQMVREFDYEMHLQAGAMRERFHHVYEWNAVGVPDAKLWRHTLSGNGSTRTAGFEFLISKTPIPTPDQRAKNPDDPMSIVAPEERAKLSKRRYVFRWKAPLMEYRMPVTIAPRSGQYLFIPTFRSEQGFIFHQGSVRQNSGNDLTAGAFTTEWAEFFGGRGQQIAGETVQRMVEEEYQQASMQWRKTARSRKVTVGIQAANDARAAFEAGRKASQTYLKKQSVRREDG